MALPPIHRIKHTPVYIRYNDFDIDRLLTTVNKLKKGADPLPISKYFSGMTRYDLSCSGYEEWLKPGRTPVKFILRRLTTAEREHLSALSEVVQWHEAFARGVIDVQGIEGVDIKDERMAGIDRLKEDVVEFFVHQPGFGLENCIYEVGKAVLKLSEDLREDEKKV